MQNKTDKGPSALPYLAGRSPTGVEPLARFLPPILDGVVEAWLSATLPLDSRSGDFAWVLDPFGSTPRVAIEAARAGYRVLVAANNPISRFLIEMAAHPPSLDELRVALAELAALRKGNERLEPHLRSLYTINCSGCGNEVEVDAYLWERGETSLGADDGVSSGPKPFASLYTCHGCGQAGEYPLSENDLTKAAQYSNIGLHRARALERVASIEDPDRQHVEEALSIYTPRAVYALFTLINRLDGLPLSKVQRDGLSAILLSVFDTANSLWPYPSGRARPRSLTTPTRFRENNVWLALEQAIPHWARTSVNPVLCTTYPELPPSGGGICIYEGRLRDLAEHLTNLPVRAVITALPRPNQAFWTLSALWAGWLWGQDAVGPFKTVLRRRRYDWAWHTAALHAAFQSLAPKLKPGTPVCGLIGEVETGFLSAATISAENSGFHLHSIAMPADSTQAQITWWRENLQTKPFPSPDRRVDDAKKAAQDLLVSLAEPAHYLKLHAAVILSQADSNSLRQSGAAPAELQPQLNSIVGEALSDRQSFLRFGGSEKSLEVGYWWLAKDREFMLALSDRIEIELVRYLIAHPGDSQLEIYQALCNKFPGFLTPSPELVQLCLESYGVKSNPENDEWSIALQNIPQARKADIHQIGEALEKMASTLRMRQEGSQPVLWLNEQGKVKFAWYIIASAIISKPVFTNPYPPKTSVVVLPGGRANLVAFKIERDPRLKQSLDDGLRLVKFRQIRWLADNLIGNQESFELLLAQDSPTYETPQLRLF